MSGSGRSFFLILILFFLLGCQSGPTEPDFKPPTNLNQASESSGSHYFMGYYSISIDTQTSEIDLVPLRTSDLHLNLTGIMNSSIGISVAGVPGESDLLNGYIVLDITIEHPFPTLTQFSGFDVKGILITRGSISFGPAVFADTHETRLVNADGYSRWWNPSEFTTPNFLGYIQGNLAGSSPGQLSATVNPYKLFADRLSATDDLVWVSDEPLDSDMGRAVFKAGESNTRRYQIQFEMNPGPIVTYGYAIDCSWKAPDPNPPEDIPSDFPMEANQPEAYRVSLIEIGNCLYYDSESGTSGGALLFDINVNDWQGQASGETNAEISTVRMYSPEMMSGGLDADFLYQTNLKAKYSAELVDVLTPDSAGQELVVARVGSEGGPAHDQGLGASAPEGDISAWQTIPVDVIDPECGIDTNNSLGEAFDLNLSGPTVDKLCAPEDYQDWWKMPLPLANTITGTVTLYCDAEPTKFALYREGSMLSEINVSGGKAEFDLTTLDLLPANYYFKVLTQTSDRAFLYMITHDLEFQDVTPNAVEVTPWDLYYNPTRIDTYGPLLFSFSSNGMWIHDTNNCINPEMLSFTPADIKLTSRPSLTYPYVFTYGNYSGTYDHIDMYDVNNHQNPEFHEGIIEIGTTVYGMKYYDGYLYVAYYFSGYVMLGVYDMVDPLNPVLVDYPAIGSIDGNIPNKMDVVLDTGSNPWLIMSPWSNHMDFFDISDPTNIPAEKQIVWGADYKVEDFDVQDFKIFVIAVDDLGDAQLECYYMDDVNGPVFKDATDLDDDAEWLEVQGYRAYITNLDGSGIDIVDITQPYNMGDAFGFGLDHLDTYDFAASFQRLFYAKGSAGTKLNDITDPDSPSNCGRTFGLANPNEFVFDGDHMYVIDKNADYRAIKSVNIEYPDAAFIQDDLVLDFNAYYLASSNGKLVATGDSNLVAVDISNPGYLQEADDETLATLARSLAMSDIAVYVGLANSTIEIYGITGWPNINFTPEIFPIVDDATQLIVNEGVLWAEINGEIYSYSIADPMNPIFKYKYTPLGLAEQVAIQDEYMYIANAGSLEICSLSNPFYPNSISSVPDPNSPNGYYLAVDNQFAFLGPKWNEIPTAVRVWPPDNPAVTGPLYGSEYLTFGGNLILNDGHLYEQVDKVALRIWDLY